MIVITIVMVLIGMLMPMVGLMRRSAAITSTQGLLKRVSMALENFRSEVGTYPYQDHLSADPYPGSNNLAYHIAHVMTPSELTALRTDASMASGRYDLSSTNGNMVIKKSNLDPQDALAGESWQDPIAAQVNRMASARARVAIHCGMISITGLKAWGLYDYSMTPLTPAPTTLGYAGDYLAGDISKKEISGNSIVDRWGRPLIFICPVAPGVMGCSVPEPLGKTMRDTRGGWEGSTWPIDPAHYSMQATGRSATSIMSSDIRRTAAESYRMVPELWSGGPDRKAAPMRNDRDNRDNIPASPYLRGLQ